MHTALPTEIQASLYEDPAFLAEGAHLPTPERAVAAVAESETKDGLDPKPLPPGIKREGSFGFLGLHVRYIFTEDAWGQAHEDYHERRIFEVSRHYYKDATVLRVVVGKLAIWIARF